MSVLFLSLSSFQFSFDCKACVFIICINFFACSLILVAVFPCAYHSLVLWVFKHSEPCHSWLSACFSFLSIHILMFTFLFHCVHCIEEMCLSVICLSLVISELENQLFPLTGIDTMGTWYCTSLLWYASDIFFVHVWYYLKRYNPCLD